MILKPTFILRALLLLCFCCVRIPEIPPPSNRGNRQVWGVFAAVENQKQPPGESSRVHLKPRCPFHECACDCGDCVFRRTKNVAANCLTVAVKRRTLAHSLFRSIDILHRLFTFRLLWVIHARVWHSSQGLSRGQSGSCVPRGQREGLFAAPANFRVYFTPSAI